MLFFVFLLWFQRKNKNNKVIKYLLFVWTVASIFSIIFYSYYPSRHSNIALIPYLYFQACFLISIYPIAKFKDSVLKNITVAHPRWLLYLMIFISIISILPFIENIIHLLSIYIGGQHNSLWDMYRDKTQSGIDYHTLNTWLSFPGQICNSIILRFNILSPFLLIYYLSRPQINKYLLIGLLIATINPLVFSLSMAGRDDAVMTPMYLLFLFLLFRKQIPSKRRKKILLFGGISFLFVFIAVAILTIVRFENNSINGDMLYFTSWYAGEATVNFSNLMWNIKEHTLGDNSFSFFKDLFGFNTFTDYLERREYWTEAKTGIPSHIFYTYIGDWFADLGITGTLLLVTILSILIRKLTHRKNGRISLFSVFAFIVFYKIILMGPTIYAYKTYYDNLIAVIGLLVIFLMSYDFKKIKLR